VRTSGFTCVSAELQASTGPTRARLQGKGSAQKDVNGSAQPAGSSSVAASGVLAAKGYMSLQSSVGTTDSQKGSGALSTSKASSFTDCHPSEPLDLNWPDFIFNLTSMCIVYMYFSKATEQRESIAAVLLCTAVAVFDITLLLMRWLWFGPPF
jgi:hypothetical protein